MSFKIRDFASGYAGRVIREDKDEDTIGKILRRDLKAVANLYVNAFTKPPWNQKITYDDAESIIANIPAKPGYDGLVAEADEKIVGFSFVHKLPRRGHEFLDPVVRRPFLYGADLAVDEDYRRQGIGEALMNERIRRAKEKKFNQLVGRTEETAKDIIALYGKLGFVRSEVKDPKDTEGVWFVKDLQRA